jgi:alkaline phosphatase D
MSCHATTTRGVLDRRRFLATGGAVAALVVADRLAGAWPARAQRGGYPFMLGVASGDPTPGGVVLWTRLAPQPLLADGGMPARAVPVDWQVAADPGLGRIARAGTVLAQPTQAHTVHVEIEGLEPARTWWYRFRAGGELSPVGRTRTLPAPGASPQRLALAVVSCQHYEHGYYTAYQHLAQEDLDLVVHLGDYIYETAPSVDQPRRHTGPAPTDLASYRLRHALYRTDPDLQAAHAATPFVLTWDDHEVENDYADDQSDASTRRRRSSGAGPPPTEPTGSICPCAAAVAPAARRRGCIAACGLATWPSCRCWTPASIATTSLVTAMASAAVRSWLRAGSG